MGRKENDIQSFYGQKISGDKQHNFRLQKVSGEDKLHLALQFGAEVSDIVDHVKATENDSNWQSLNVYMTIDCDDLKEDGTFTATLGDIPFRGTRDSLRDAR